MSHQNHTSLRELLPDQEKQALSKEGESTNSALTIVTEYESLPGFSAPLSTCRATQETKVVLSSGTWPTAAKNCHRV